MIVAPQDMALKPLAGQEGKPLSWGKIMRVEPAAKIGSGHTESDLTSRGDN